MVKVPKLCIIVYAKTYNTTPDVITRRNQPYVVVLCLIICKRETPRSKGDTSGVSAKGTSILKSVSGTDQQAKK